MAAQSWPEVADNAVTRLPTEYIAWAFWALLVVVVIAALLHVRRVLYAPIAADLKAAVRDGINGTAERMQRVEALLQKMDDEQGRTGQRLAKLEGQVESLLSMRRGVR